MTDINTIADQIEAVIQTNIIDGSGEAKQVNDYRTFPGHLPFEVSIIFLGKGDRGSTSGGAGHYMDFGLALGATVTEDSDGKTSETEIRTADRGLNDLEDALDALFFEKGGAGYEVRPYWMKCSRARPSARIPTPIDRPRVLRGEMYLRLILI